MHLYEEFKDRVDLARAYMEDGAYRTAAIRLRALAERLDEEADADDAFLAAVIQSRGI